MNNTKFVIIDTLESVSIVYHIRTTENDPASYALRMVEVV